MLIQNTRVSLSEICIFFSAPHSTSARAAEELEHVLQVPPFDWLTTVTPLGLRGIYITPGYGLQVYKLHFLKLDQEFFCILPSLARLYSAAASPSSRLRSDGSLVISKTTTLSVHHPILYIYLPSLHNYDMKLYSFTFCGGHEQKTKIF